MTAESKTIILAALERSKGDDLERAEAAFREDAMQMPYSSTETRQQYIDRLRKQRKDTEMALREFNASVKALEVLREFMSDIEAVGAKQTGKEWPDLLITYNKARMIFAEVTRG